MARLTSITARVVPSTRRSTVIPAAVLLLLAGGCDRPDPQSRAIAEARNTLAATGAGGSAAAPRESLDKNYGKVLATIRQTGDGSDAGKAIASAIEAGALSGQGDLAADEFRRAQGVLRSELNAAGALLRLYSEQRGLEASLAGYDPNSDIARFDDLIAERTREREASMRALAEQKKQVDDLLARSRSLAEQAKGMMQSQAALRQRLIDASSAERPALAEQLHKARREAESVVKESEILEAEAAKIEPITGEIELRVRQVERQIESLNAAKERARDLARSRAAQADEARRAAERTSGELTEAVNAALAVLNDQVKPAFNAALSKMSQAASKYGQSRGGPDQRLLSVSSGSAALAMGGLQREYGESLRLASTLVDLASRARPPLAHAEEFAAASAALADESRQANEAALQQYEKARSLFQAGGGTAEARERLDRLSARLNETWIRLGGKPPEEPPAATESHDQEGAPEGMAPDEHEDAPEGEPAPVEETEAPPADEPPADEPPGR